MGFVGQLLIIVGTLVVLMFLAAYTTVRRLSRRDRYI